VRFQLQRAEVRPGESWAQAADRVAAVRLGRPVATVGPVLAVDLSADPLEFGVDDRRLAVRPMTRGDLGDVQRWVNAPHVARWWDEHRSPEQVAAYYGPALDGADPTRMWVWEVNGRSVGFSQDYRVADHPDWALLCGRPDAIGFDYAVGDPAFVGAGAGTLLLWVFLRDIVVPAYAGVRELFAAPDHRNLASLRVLDKLGATRGVWFDEPRSDGGVDTVVGCSIDVAKVIGTGTVTDR
jgi:RimJ/RimL family protein N-acetyltransferase